jgi:O-antigen/teichoic acid export membrane protein
MLALGPLLASYHFGMANAGFLLAGQAIFQMVEVAIYSFHIVMLPRAAVLHAEGHVEVLREMVSDVIIFISHVGLYATLHLLVWSRALILAWLGDLYADAVPLMRLLLVAVIPYTAHIMLRSFIDAVDHRPVNTINLGIALLGVMLASLLALNFGWGAAGLALSTSLGYWMLAALSVRYLRSHFDLRDHQFMVVKLVMANVVLLLPSLGMAGLLQTYLNRAIILAFAALVEGILFLIFCAVMWRSGARWMSEVMKRIVADAAL